MGRRREPSSSPFSGLAARSRSGLAAIAAIAPLLVRSGRSRVMIDCGADWLNDLKSVTPSAIVITHADPDHAFGLAQGAPGPVYATETPWALLSNHPVKDRRIVRPREPFLIGEVSFEAFPVDHSLLAPAYRVKALDG